MYALSNNKQASQTPLIRHKLKETHAHTHTQNTPRISHIYISLLRRPFSQSYFVFPNLIFLSTQWMSPNLTLRKRITPYGSILRCSTSLVGLRNTCNPSFHPTRLPNEQTTVIPSIYKLIVSGKMSPTKVSTWCIISTFFAAVEPLHMPCG